MNASKGRKRRSSLQSSATLIQEDVDPGSVFDDLSSVPEDDPKPARKVSTEKSSKRIEKGPSVSEDDPKQQNKVLPEEPPKRIENDEYQTMVASLPNCFIDTSSVVNLGNLRISKVVVPIPIIKLRDLMVAYEVEIPEKSELSDDSTILANVSDYPEEEEVFLDEAGSDFEEVEKILSISLGVSIFK